MLKALLLILFIVLPIFLVFSFFSAQNTAIVTVNYLFATADVPLGLTLMAVFFSGLIVGLIIASIYFALKKLFTKKI